MRVVAAVVRRTLQPLGEKYFGLIVRARFATTHRVYQTCCVQMVCQRDG